MLIPTHNRTRLLVRLIESLRMADEDAQHIDYWLLENGSSVALPILQATGEWENLHYRHYEKGNKSEALNQVMKEISPTGLLVFLDDDVTIHPDFFQTYRKAAAAYGSGHYFGGPVNPDYVVAPSVEIRPYLPPSCRKFDLSAGQQVREFSEYRLFLGANWACFA
ncbi:MAG: glycosyltransferase family A protein, partial [Bacteroidota bacterium]